MTSDVEYSRKYRRENLDKSRAWNREYARRHHARIAAKLAKKMQDPKHAESVRTYHREYWKACVSGNRVPWSPPLFHEIDGQQERVFRTSEAARLLHCSSAVICKWHAKNWIPLPLVVNGRRLYRRYQVDLMGVLMSVRQRDFTTRTKVLKFISENW